MLCEYIKQKENLDKVKVEIKENKLYSNEWYEAYLKAIDILNYMERLRHEEFSVL